MEGSAASMKQARPRVNCPGQEELAVLPFPPGRHVLRTLGFLHPRSKWPDVQASLQHVELNADPIYLESQPASSTPRCPAAGKPHEKPVTSNKRSLCRHIGLLVCHAHCRMDAGRCRPGRLTHQPPPHPATDITVQGPPQNPSVGADRSSGERAQYSSPQFPWD